MYNYLTNLPIYLSTYQSRYLFKSFYLSSEELVANLQYRLPPLLLPHLPLQLPPAGRTQVITDGHTLASENVICHWLCEIGQPLAVNCTNKLYISCTHIVGNNRSLAVGH